MAIEAKLGMFIIMILVSAFGFLVYRNIDRHQQMLAGGGDKTPETSDQLPEDLPGTPVATPEEADVAPELNFGDLALTENVPDEPDPVVAFEQMDDATVTSVDADSGVSDEWNEVEPSLAAQWNEAPAEPSEEDADPFPAFDVAAAEPPADRQSAVDVDPFAQEGFSDSQDTQTFRDEEPLTNWTESEEPQIAATDSPPTDTAPATDFFEDANAASQESTEIPELTEPEPDTNRNKPVITFGLEGIPELPEEYRQRPAVTEPQEPELAVQDPQLPLPEAGDGWSAVDDDEVLVVEDADPPSLPSGFDEDPGFAPADIQSAPTQSSEQDYEFWDSAAQVGTDDSGSLSGEMVPGPDLIIVEEEEPLLGLSEPADTTISDTFGTPDNFDPVDQDDAFSDSAEPQLQLEPEPQIEIAARNDDDIESDFTNSYEAPEIRPRPTVDDIELPQEPVLPPAEEPIVEEDQQFAQFDEFPLRDAGDDAAAQLRPVTPAGGPEPPQSSFTQDERPFDAREFAYENTVVTASAEEQPFDICEVRPGDNYWKISRRMYGTSRYFSALALYNRHRVRDPKKLRPGMKVLIPDALVLEDKYPELFRDSEPREQAPGGYFVQRDGTPAYRIGERDTLSEIAQKHLGRSSRWIQIYRLNRNVLSNPNRLKPGTVIILPDSATNVQMAP